MKKNIKNLLDPVALDSLCGVDLDETGELYRLEKMVEGKPDTQFS